MITGTIGHRADLLIEIDECSERDLARDYSDLIEAMDGSRGVGDLIDRIKQLRASCGHMECGGVAMIHSADMRPQMVAVRFPATKARRENRRSWWRRLRRRTKRYGRGA